MHQYAIVYHQPTTGFMPQVLHHYGNRDSEEASSFPFTLTTQKFRRRTKSSPN
ncbi:hypothetical protein KXW58_006122 [Aspergillus fumigatus]|nr:hypothetical protein KXW58_006122 [Aspergillus fumigatus]